MHTHFVHTRLCVAHFCVTPLPGSTARTCLAQLVAGVRGYLGSGYKISPEGVEELAEGSREVKTGEVEGGTVCLEGGRGQESAQDRARTLTGARGKADLESGKGQGVWFAQQSAHGSAIQAGCVEQKGRDALAI